MKITMALSAGCTAFAFSLGAYGQAVESDLAPAPGSFEPAERVAQEFAIPDIPSVWYEKFQLREHWLTMKFGLVLIQDYTSFDQDADNLRQVGKQEDAWDTRAARAMIRGTLGRDYKANYLISGEYKGFATDAQEKWQMTDVSLTFPINGPATKLTAGKTKQTFAYEMVGDAANLPHQERVLSPFFVSRDTGLRLSQVIGKQQRMTAAAGVYNDSFVRGDSFEDNGTDFSGRLTGLAWDHPADQSFLHLGIAGRYADANKGTVRYAARPESNVADNFLDTGKLEADGAYHLGLELLWNHGPFSILAEYIRAWVDSTVYGDPEFYGYYITASWVLTGETRPYDRTVGYARRVMPTGRWGAPELVARYAYDDLNDKEVAGGAFEKTYLGINWWATARWKFGFGWSRTWLDRDATEGVMDSYLSRIQWVF